MNPCDMLKPLKLITWHLHLFSTRFNGYIKCILLIFNMDELREQCGAQIARLFHPIDFSNIAGFPKFGHDVGDKYKWLPVFHGNYGDSAIWHVKYFLQLMADSTYFIGTIWCEFLLILWKRRHGYGFLVFLINALPPMKTYVLCFLRGGIMVREIWSLL